jgi:hypothetical protein
VTRDARLLMHGARISRGSTALYRRYCSALSRRDMQAVVRMARFDMHVEHRRNLRRIEWKQAGIVWAMDATEYPERDERNRRIHVHQLQDLGSRYKFGPLAGAFPCGEEIAAHLACQFRRFGSPLFLKRDNAGVMAHQTVNDVLAQYFVLPLNSPPEYPPYNGGIEEAQKELKIGLHHRLAGSATPPQEHIETYAATVAHDLNHYPRQCLNGKNSCQVFFQHRLRAHFTKRERRAIYDWIMDLRNGILSECQANGRPRSAESAWRIAAEAWLRKNGYITVSINRKVSPSFPGENYHE